MHRTACDVGIDGAQIFEVTVALIEIPDIDTRENSDEIFTLLGNISVAQTFRYLGNLYEFRFGIFFEVGHQSAIIYKQLLRKLLKLRFG